MQFPGVELADGVVIPFSEKVTSLGVMFDRGTCLSLSRLLWYPATQRIFRAEDKTSTIAELMYQIYIWIETRCTCGPLLENEGLVADGHQTDVLYTCAFL